MNQYTRQVRCCASLIHQHHLYEANYQRLTDLLSVWEKELEEAFIWQREVCLGCVTFQVLQKARYTTLLEVCLLLNTGQWPGPQVMKIRIYHDVKMAEVVSANGIQRLKPVNPYPNPNMLMPDEKWQLNGLLSQWLDDCQLYGSAP